MVMRTRRCWVKDQISYFRHVPVTSSAIIGAPSSVVAVYTFSPFSGQVYSSTSTGIVSKYFPGPSGLSLPVRAASTL